MRKQPLALFALLWIHTASAWGNLGHRITGDIAEALLTPGARKQIQQLLGEESLAAAATYMDQQRQLISERWPEATRWHYDNQPVCGDATYCRDGQCATRQIVQFQQILSDKTASHADRALALRLLVHMLGDIHQPLHMADDHDRGGNDIPVRLSAGAERRNLHEVLDTGLLRQLIGRQPFNDYATQLMREHRPRFDTWSRGTPTQWAAESHQLAVTDVYGRLPGFACGKNEQRTLTLPPEFVIRAKTWMPEQLTKAGVRIAAVLNATLQ